MERNVNAHGSVYGTANIFRTILPGDQSFNIGNYRALQFNAKNSLPVEVILVTENLENWDKRYRLQMNAYDEYTLQNLSLAEFSNSSNKYQGEAIKAIVFSIKGNYSNYQDFEIGIQDVKFNMTDVIPL